MLIVNIFHLLKKVLNVYILSTGSGKDNLYLNIGAVSNYICSGSTFSDVTVTGMINATGKYCNTGGFGGISEKIAYKSTVGMYLNNKQYAQLYNKPR